MYLVYVRHNKFLSVCDTQPYQKKKNKKKHSTKSSNSLACFYLDHDHSTHSTLIRYCFFFINKMIVENFSRLKWFPKKKGGRERQNDLYRFFTPFKSTWRAIFSFSFHAQSVIHFDRFLSNKRWKGGKVSKSNWWFYCTTAFILRGNQKRIAINFFFIFFLFVLYFLTWWNFKAIFSFFILV